jgi:hypothetical protein
LASYDFTIVYRPGNLKSKPVALSRRPESHPEKGYSSENSLQPISLVLNPEHFVLEIMLDGFGMWTVISGSNLYAVLPINFNRDLIELVVMATMEDEEWQYAYNVAEDGNPSANVEYLQRALYCTGLL